jgi:hypothetical protein
MYINIEKKVILKVFIIIYFKSCGEEKFSIKNI